MILATDGADLYIKNQPVGHRACVGCPAGLLLGGWVLLRFSGTFSAFLSLDYPSNNPSNT